MRWRLKHEVWAIESLFHEEEMKQQRLKSGILTTKNSLVAKTLLASSKVRIKKNKVLFGSKSSGTSIK